MNYYKQFILCFFIGFISICCNNIKDFEKVLYNVDIGIEYILPFMESPNHESGIALFTADWARKNRTEMGSEYLVRKSSSVGISQQIIRNGLNSALRIDFKNMSKPSDFLELLMSGYGAISDKNSLPIELLEEVIGIKFKVGATGQPINLTLEAFSIGGSIIEKQTFVVEQTELTEFSLMFDASAFKYLSFKISYEDQESDYEGSLDTAIIIDDIYFITDDDSIFIPPMDDTELLKWVQRSAIRFFIWNYRDLGNNRGFVLGSTEWHNTLSIGGQAFGMAAYILAEKEGMMTHEESKRRILGMLKWMQDQNWYNGEDGWKGFPHHWFNADGTPGYDGYGTSTVDWAIAAAGIRVVRQYYFDDEEINSIATELLARPKWSEVFDNNGLIAMGINIETGAINPWRWGNSFTEEADLTFLEARNSNQMDKTIFNSIIREKLYGFYPGWWSTGFEFNWMQLWTGPIEPYKTNSTVAYQNDATTCQSAFGIPIMGLAASGITTKIDDDGFAEIQYFGDQGSSPCRSNDSKQIAPAPYGAALALPFVSNQALTGFKEFVKLGYYHPLLGFPGTVRLIPLGGDAPNIIPNWGTGDLELGPIAIAIDQYNNNIIGQLYQNDPEVQIALSELIESIQN